MSHRPIMVSGVDSYGRILPNSLASITFRESFIPVSEQVSILLRPKHPDSKLEVVINEERQILTEDETGLISLKLDSKLMPCSIQLINLGGVAIGNLINIIEVAGTPVLYQQPTVENAYLKLQDSILDNTEASQVYKVVNDCLNSENSIKLELGSWKKYGTNGWKTIDTVDECDITWDLKDGIPFPDCSVDTIYSSHFLEHLTFEQGQRMLKECLRVMRPGALFSICLPDALIFIDAYFNPEKYPQEKYCAYTKAFSGTTPLSYLNYIAYMDGHHHYLFDQAEIIAILTKAGLFNAEGRGFNPELDDESRDYQSIYAQAYKLI